jgi:uncharacterized protein YjbI with pentapeptide repeats
MEGRRRPLWIWALACLLGFAALAGIILAVWKLPSLLYGDVSKASADARLQAASGFRTALVAGLAGLAALGGLAMATRTYRLTQQGQITERYTKAIEQLGSDKLDVRLGGIYALERIANDSKRDHPTVVEVLSAFVREHSHPAQTNSEPSMAKLLNTKPKPMTDVKAALTVLGRLPSHPTTVLLRADLSTAHFERADLSLLRLWRFGLSGANLQGADLHWAFLQEADLRGADLQGANLQMASLLDADLYGAALDDADLRGANLQGANLEGVVLEGADLTGAVLRNATLRDTILVRARLGHTDLEGANLQHAELEGANLQAAKCDADTVWPDGFDWKAAGVTLQD